MTHATNSPAPPATAPTAPPADRLREMIAAQGVEQSPTFDALAGRGKDLWADDAELDRFLRSAEDTRAEKG